MKLTKLEILSLFVAGLVTGLAIAYVNPARADPPIGCTPGPGEISHQDPAGLCAITHKGRLVTRYQM